MIKNLVKWVFVLFILIYSVIQIYFNLTVVVFTPINTIEAGTPITTNMLSEQREFRSNVPPTAVQDLYYFDGKEAYVTLQAGTVILTNGLTNVNTSVESVLNLDDAMESLAIIYVPLELGQYFTGIKANDVVKLSYTIEPGETDTTGTTFQTLYGVQAIVKNVTSINGTDVNGMDIIIPKEIANELVLLNKIGNLTVIKVFTEEELNNESITAVDLIVKLLNEY